MFNCLKAFLECSFSSYTNSRDIGFGRHIGWTRRVLDERTVVAEESGLFVFWLPSSLDGGGVSIAMVTKLVSWSNPP